MNLLLQIAQLVLGSYEQRKDEYLFHCPKCKHYKKKLSLNFERNVYKCWVCEPTFSGNDISNLIRLYGTYEQLKTYKSYLHSNNSLLTELLAVKKKKITTSIPDEYIFLLNEVDKDIYSFLKNREITREDIFKWKIGFAKKGKYYKRAIFPSFNEYGECNYFVARATKEDFKIPYLIPDDVSKNDIIFNELNIDWTKPIYLTEGVFDAIKLGDNAIPLLGKTLSPNSLLLQKLYLYNPPIKLCLDSDLTKKGIVNRSIAIAELLMKYGIEDITIIDPFPWKDFGEIPRSEIQSVLEHTENANNEYELFNKKLKQLEMAIL